MRVPRTHGIPPMILVIDQDTSREIDRSAGLFLSNRAEFRITGITPFGLLGDASGQKDFMPICEVKFWRSKQAPWRPSAPLHYARH